jgi:orotidine-5'-phosphate decarboxylase
VVKLDRDRTLIPACDVSMPKYEQILIATKDIPEVEAVKVGFQLVLEEGLKTVVQHRILNKEKFYNHESGATDIPDLGAKFMQTCKNSGVDGVILGFFSGPATADAWIRAAKEQNLKIIGESYLGFSGFLADEGGYINRETVARMHKDLLGLGLKDFILPARSIYTPEKDLKLLERLEQIIRNGQGNVIHRFVNGGLDAKITEITAPEAMEIALPKLAKMAHDHGKKVIYDHQKAGTTTATKGQRYCDACKEAGVDYAIFFPQAGYETERAWIAAAKNSGITPIIGGKMTHPKYVASEGGYIDDSAIERMYSFGKELGAMGFVAPGNQPDEIKRIRGYVDIPGQRVELYMPGFGMKYQKGEITQAGAAAGKHFHPIVGRDITSAENMKEAAMALAAKL